MKSDSTNNSSRRLREPAVKVDAVASTGGFALALAVIWPVIARNPDPLVVMCCTSTYFSKQAHPPLKLNVRLVMKLPKVLSEAPTRFM